MPKTAKTIFNTTEKSNFILNMKPEAYYGYNLKILKGFLILMPVFSIVLEFAKVYSVPGMALAITGVFAIVFVFIGFMKSETPKALFLPAGILAAMLVWGGISLYNSYDYYISIFGADGRSEGWLSILFYGSFFMLGAQLGNDENQLKLLHTMLCMGLAECAWGILQALPIGIPSYYQNLEPLLLFRIFLPSGLTGSPVFLAILLVMLLFPAIIGAAMTENKKHKRLYHICSICFAVMAVKTQCLIGLAGTILAIFSAWICALVQKSGKRACISAGIALCSALIGFGWAWISPTLNNASITLSEDAASVANGYTLYDGVIFWKDSSYRLETSGYYMPSAANPNGNFDASSVSETYSYIWSATMDIIQSYPLVGSGPDNLVYPQLYQNLAISSNPNTFDRCYNYYLHTAATLGIPMLVLCIGLMLLTIIRGIKACRKSHNWLYTAIVGAVILYLVIMLIGTSCITVAPLFWMLAGMCSHLRSTKPTE